MQPQGDFKARVAVFELGRQSQLLELRQFERDQLLSGAQSVKKSDDASAVYCLYADK